MDALWGHDKAGVGFAWQILGLAHNAPLARPAIEGAIGEVAKAPAGCPLCSQAACAFAISVMMCALRRSFFASPKTKST